MIYDRCFGGSNPNLGERVSLSASILKESPSVKVQVADELERLVNKYNINWIPDNKNGGGYFLTPHLAQAKGKHVKDFSKRWKENKDKIVELFKEKEGVYPNVMLIKGDELKILKALWKHYIGDEDALKGSSVFVCNWAVAYWYLTRGSSQAALEFTNLGATAIAGIKESTSISLSEEEIQTRLALLSTYSHYIKLTQEVTVVNTLDTSTRTKRFDMVERRGKEVIIYELKRDRITVDHVKETIGVKGYLDLAKKRYRGKKVRLVFLSPNGIDDAAKRLIRYNTCITYRTVAFLVDRLKRSIKRSTPKAGSFKFDVDVFPRILEGIDPTLSTTNDKLLLPY